MRASGPVCISDMQELFTRGGSKDGQHSTLSGLGSGRRPAKHTCPPACCLPSCLPACLVHPEPTALPAHTTHHTTPPLCHPPL